MGPRSPCEDAFLVNRPHVAFQTYVLWGKHLEV